MFYIKNKYNIHFRLLLVLFFSFFNFAKADTFVDYSDLSPWVLNTPNDAYPYKGFILEPTENFSFNNIQVLTKTLADTNPYIPLTFCLWRLNNDYLMVEKIQCSNTKYNASDIPTTFTIKDFDFKDYTLVAGEKYSFVYGPDEYAPFTPFEVEGRMGYAVMQGPGALGINKNGAWYEPYHLYLAYDTEAGIYSVNSTPFFAKTKNKATGVIKMYESPTTSSASIKQLPMDWSLEVLDTTNEDGEPIIANGYRWYQIKDKTDDVVGWMSGATSDGITRYLSIDTQNQDQLESDASDFVDVADRPDLIIEAVDHYYNNEDENYSLYSGDDGANNISTLKDRGFPYKVIWGIAAQENGPDFNNERVTYDYGHGIMQITPYKLYAHEATGNWVSNAGDNRGISNNLKIFPCTSDHSNLYVNCYKNAGLFIKLSKPYKNYADIVTNPKYKYYTNTKQSIFSNIKDGMRILKDKYSGINITTPITIGATTYSALDREIILVTEKYNGNNCGYVNDVANVLDVIEEYYPDQNIEDIEELVGKMHTAGESGICVYLHSPVELFVEDSIGNKVGLINGEGINDFPLAVYDKDEEFVKILLPHDSNYTYNLVGKENGFYGIDIIIKKGKDQIKYSLRNIKINKKETNTLSFIKDKYGKTIIQLNRDTNYDNEVDSVEYPNFSLDSLNGLNNFSNEN